MTLLSLLPSRQDPDLWTGSRNGLLPDFRLFGTQRILSNTRFFIFLLLGPSLVLSTPPGSLSIMTVIKLIGLLLPGELNCLFPSGSQV